MTGGGTVTSTSTVTGTVGWIGVVVPARDEQELLPACLTALVTAAARVAVPVMILVVLDACEDDTAGVVAGMAAALPGRATPTAGPISRLAPPVEIRAIDVDLRNVGAARDAGFRDLLAARPLAALGGWLATTDADSIVPSSWLTSQLAHARAGADAVVGAIRVADWHGHPPIVPRAFHRRYRLHAAHRHVHGANLAMSAHVYHAVGGFRPLAVGEDHAFVADVEHAGHTVVRTIEPLVVTSARREARAAGGFGDLLRSLADASLSSHSRLPPPATDPRAPAGPSAASGGTGPVATSRRHRGWWWPRSRAGRPRGATDAGQYF